MDLNFSSRITLSARMGRNGDHRSASHICHVEGSETSLAIGLLEMNAQK